MSWDKKIPFDENGDMFKKYNEAKHAEHLFKRLVDYREIYTFHDSLQIVTSIKTHIEVQSLTTGRYYYIVLSELVRILNITTVKKGRITGNWTFFKVGDAYSLKYLSTT